MKLALALAPVALVGCKPHGQTRGPGSAVAPPEPAGLTITQPGAMPRQVLRYHPARGAQTAYELDVDSEMSAGVDATASMALHLAQAVEDVAPDGHLQLRTTIQDAALHGDSVPTSAVHELDKLKGASVVTTLAPDGTMQDAKVDTGGQKLPEAIAQQLDMVAAQLRQAAMQLPAAPLGVGAAWQTHGTLQIAGMHVDVAWTFEITAIAGTRVSFRDHSELHAADQTVMLGGASLTASGISGTEHGTGTIDLATLAMTRESRSELHAGMAAGSEAATPVTMKMTLKLAPQ